jgi:hypothetical protein
MLQVAGLAGIRTHKRAWLSHHRLDIHGRLLGTGDYRQQTQYYPYFAMDYRACLHIFLLVDEKYLKKIDLFEQSTGPFQLLKDGKKNLGQGRKSQRPGTGSRSELPENLLERKATGDKRHLQQKPAHDSIPIQIPNLI